MFDPHFYSALTYLVMQSAVLATVNPSVCLSAKLYTLALCQNVPGG